MGRHRRKGKPTNAAVWVTAAASVGRFVITAIRFSLDYLNR